VTEVTLRLLRKPEVVRTMVGDFASPSAAGAAVAGLVGAGIVPAAVEMIDNLAIQACEDAVGAGFSRTAGAVLIVELDGVPGDVEAEFEAARRLCIEAGATHLRVAADAAERALIWAWRKAAFAAVGHLSPDYVVQDGVIPRGRLPEVLDRIGRKSREAGMRVANVFHAGDGNLHPLVLYDGAREGEAARALRLSIEIVELCVDYGGSISGEHGIGFEKAGSMPRMFSRDDLDVMQRVRAAFDPAGRCNPGKIFPAPGLCGEGTYRRSPLEEAATVRQP
jgi:glycolate oxidase